MFSLACQNDRQTFMTDMILAAWTTICTKIDRSKLKVMIRLMLHKYLPEYGWVILSKYLIPQHEKIATREWQKDKHWNVHRQHSSGIIDNSSDYLPSSNGHWSFWARGSCTGLTVIMTDVQAVNQIGTCLLKVGIPRRIFSLRDFSPHMDKNGSLLSLCLLSPPISYFNFQN